MDHVWIMCELERWLVGGGGLKRFFSSANAPRVVGMINVHLCCCDHLSARVSNPILKKDPRHGIQVVA